MDIHYQIQFFSDWHCGSGLAAGADVDALAIKDKNDLPFIPGKTIKGLFREAVGDVLHFNKIFDEKKDSFHKAFGYFNSEEDVRQGDCFFTNAELPENQRKVIIKNKISQYLYHTVASTAIENGIAKDKSLRRIETVAPCKLVGNILNVPDDLEKDIENGLGFIKRLGLNRNRGLGRCQITIEKGGDI